LQLLADGDGPVGEQNSLFVSVSQAGDGRAPAGCATITASAFTDPQLWWLESQAAYEARKQAYTDSALAQLRRYFTLTPETIRHQEAATPLTFARFTGRAWGYVGGVGQRVRTFGPFGFATRTAVRHLWLVGDSTHPGEGTAGMSYSALTAVRRSRPASARHCPTGGAGSSARHRYPTAAWGARGPPRGSSGE
jgi:phytoene dehydrogenase-like protein